MAELPVAFRIHMQESDSQMEPGAEFDDGTDDPVARLFERAAVAVSGGSSIADIEQLEKSSPSIKRIEGTGNPWIDFPTINSQPISAPPLTPVDESRDLMKRIGDSTRRTSLRDFVKRRLATGATIEELAEHARRHDEATALLIEEVGAEL